MLSGKIITGVSVIAVIIGVLVLAGCTQPQNQGNFPDNNAAFGTDQNIQSPYSGSQNIIKFGSIEQVRAFLEQEKANSALAGNSSRQDLSLGISKTMAEGSPSAAPMADSSSGAADYSQTNNQVEGVDEADFVKNDSHYIYMISGEYLLIFDALDSAGAKQLSKTSLKELLGSTSENSYPQFKELLLNGEKLVVFAEEQKPDTYFPPFDIKPVESSRPETSALVLNVSDRASPKVSAKFSATGSYSESRMIGNSIYFITQEGTNYYGRPVPEPFVISQAGGKIAPPIYYFDNPEDEHVFTTITSIDLASESVKDAKTLLLGWSNTVYVSQDNLYIAYKKNDWRCWGFWRGCWNSSDSEAEMKARFFEVVVPMLPSEVKDKISQINADGSKNDSEKWAGISAEIEKYYDAAKASSSSDERKNLDSIASALEEYDVKKALEKSQTVIHKLSLKDGVIEYAGKGEALGDLLSQYSLDEYNGYLRVASTIDTWASKRIQNSLVTVFDSGMGVAGKLEGISPDERIYSARFMQDRLYLVTFKQTDPFFVIDLSNPSNPAIAGKLKLPGFSQYLHPLDATHIIGIGKDADTETGRAQGLKIALFDVSNPADPKVVSEKTIGDQGSDSEVLRDAKAFLLSKTKEIMVLPVMEVSQLEKTSEYSYRSKVWYGAIVYKVSAEGFEEIGRIEHSSKTQDYYDWWDQAVVKRSLYLDDRLFTISTKYLKANDWSKAGLPELSSAELPEGTQYNNYPMMVE